MSERLLILGASARAAVQSARRAGLSAQAADLFADVDLRNCCLATRAENYPQDFADIARRAAPGPWMYTGALENWPELVEEISSQRTLYGNCSSVLRQVRDPWALARVFSASCLKFPAIARTANGLPLDGTWLRKPLASCGGTSIAPWGLAVPWGLADQEIGEEKSNNPAFYYQSRIVGKPCSAVYVAAGHRAVLLGVTEQLIGSASLVDGQPSCATGVSPVPGATAGLSNSAGTTAPAEDFRYCGSLGPLQLSVDMRKTFEEIGSRLAREFDLRGLFGVDAILGDSDGSESIWPVEVNPRYTASVEVLERALGLKAVGLHVQACRDGQLPDTVPDAAPGTFGKVIIYAQGNLVVSESFTRLADQQNANPTWPALADLPMAGTSISADAPVTTILGRAANRTGLLIDLKALMLQVEHTLDSRVP